ncbi:MAG: hypothetical protein ACKOD7_05015 [Polynucleobacter victoriensis]
MEYTVELYKVDKRYKEGKRLSIKVDLEDVTLAQVERMYPVRKGYVREIHETYVTKKNLMGGAEFRERYDTPYFCSPASESYWSM